MNKKRIYAADDEANIREILEVFLKEAGFEVTVFETGDELLREFAALPSDMVILDIMMPGSDGITICKELRKISSVPIIILTAKETEADYMIGITSGGDDYLIKPFSPSMLVMRIKALFRRIEMEHAGEAEKEERAYGDLLYSASRHAVFCGEEDLGLTELELAFLRFLLQHPEQSVSRETLLDAVWGFDRETETRVTDETVRRIRKKLRRAGSRVTVVTVWGYGYRLGEVL
ncbi:MAG: response regulator transcription factor [Eubacterium sp.]|nr:response regulator transcription factor [Eubacterium sp.]